MTNQGNELVGGAMQSRIPFPRVPPHRVSHRSVWHFPLRPPMCIFNNMTTLGPVHLGGQQGFSLAVYTVQLEILLQIRDRNKASIYSVHSLPHLGGSVHIGPHKRGLSSSYTLEQTRFESNNRICVRGNLSTVHRT